MKRNILLLLSLLLLVPATMQAQSNWLETLNVLRPIHPWHKAKVAYFGDSITDPRNNGSKKKYWGFLQDYLGITPYVYGVSGREWNDIPRQTDKLKTEHGDDVDAILIFCGTNDYNHHVPLGRWYEEVDTTTYFAEGKPKTLQHRVFRRLAENDSTFCGRINKALHKLRQTYPNKQIVLLTPIHRSFFGPNDKNWQPDEGFGNSIGLYISDYARCVREAGQIWSMPVIDLYSISGLTPQVNGSLYFHNASDLLHPNDNGHDRMARTLVYQLLSLPCKF